MHIKPHAVRVHAGCSAFPFNTPTKPLLRSHIKYKTVVFPKLQIIFIIYIFEIKSKYKQYIHFWSVFGIMNRLLRVSCKVNIARDPKYS